MASCAPTSGRAALFGLDAWHEAPAVHERISFVGSEPGYLGELTAAEQLDYLARLRRLPRSAWRPVAERFELDPTVADQAPVAGQSPEGRRRPGIHGRRPAADPRRADVRPGPADAARVPGGRGRGPRRRPDGLPLLAQPPRGRAELRPGRDHPRRPAGRDRDRPGAPGRPLAFGQPRPRPVRRARHVRPAERPGRVDHRARHPPDGPWRRQSAPAPDQRARRPGRVHHHTGDRGRVPAPVQHQRASPKPNVPELVR